MAASIFRQRRLSQNNLVPTEPPAVMKLPHPQEKLAGCCWLPRLAEKTRFYLRGEMPFSYRAAFGSSIGVDGYFLRHFKLSRSQIIAAVRIHATDEKLAQWFLARASVTTKSITDWNMLAPKIGARNHPGYLTRQIVKWIFYPKSVRHPVGSIFEAIIQDEDLAP